MGCVFVMYFDLGRSSVGGEVVEDYSLFKFDIVVIFGWGKWLLEMGLWSVLFFVVVGCFVVFLNLRKEFFVF